jgi:hypothetical protein
MIYGNPKFEKNSIINALNYMGHVTYHLMYSQEFERSSPQFQAGKNVENALLLLAFINDHVFDYSPWEHFMNTYERKKSLEIKDSILRSPKAHIEAAIESVKKDFNLVGEEGTSMIFDKRNLEKESNIQDVFNEINKNIDEFCRLINGPKKITDSSKPQSYEIKELIECIIVILHVRKYYEPKSGGNDAVMQHFKIGKMYEMFLFPLLKALDVYEYGEHTDYWKEGDSMMDYMMFDFNAKQIINQLIMILENQSPFIIFESDGKITKGLLKIYRDMLKRF